MAKLTNKRHIQFCDEYLSNGMIGTKAYMSVYKNVTKERTAEANASRLLSNAKVKAYIAEKQAELAKDKEIDRQFIIDEYMELLNSCKAEGLDGQGTIKDRANWTKALAQITKMLGLDEPDKAEITHKGLTVNYVKPNKKDEGSND